MSIDLFYFSVSPSCSIRIRRDPDGNWTDSTLMPTERFDWKYIRLTLTSAGVAFCFPNDNYNPQTCFISSPGRYAFYLGEIIAISGSHHIDNPSPVLLITDLDDTLISTRPQGQSAMRRFFTYWIATHLFNGSRLVYSTGRPYDKYLRVYREQEGMLLPDLAVISVGSEAFTVHPTTGEHRKMEEYERGLSFENWDTEIVAKMVEERFPWVRKRVELRGEERWAILREIDAKDAEKYHPEMRLFFENKENRKTLGKVIKGNVFVSGSGPVRYCDFLPMGGGKRASVVFALRFFSFPPSRTFVCGDSANDIPMLQGSEHGVLPANSQPELITWFQAQGRFSNKSLSQSAFADAIIDGLMRTFS